MTTAVIATRRYQRDVERLLAPAERAAMEEALAAAPEAHPIVPGAGGVRKARWGRHGKGKRGGVRVIYYYWIPGHEVYLLTVYAKSAQVDLTAEDRKAAKIFVEMLKREKQGKVQDR